MKLWAIIPELIVAGLSLILIPFVGFAKRKYRNWISYISIIGLAISIYFAFRMLHWESFTVFIGTYAVDPFGNVFKILILIGSILVLFQFIFYFKNNYQIAHVPIALLFATLGAIGITSSTDLALITLFLQMMSLASYILVGIIRTDKTSNEAAIKYFIFAAAALAIMAFGLTFLYGLTGSLNLMEIGNSVSGSGNAWVFFALMLVLLGYGFEVTMIPFHFWAPDVYAGTNSPVAGFISVVPKIAGFAGLVRILYIAFPENLMNWQEVVAVFAAITMTWGNIAALKQNKLKRLLAYSSIAQSGYIIMAVSVTGLSDLSFSSIGFYLLAYLFMNLGAFAVVSQIERNYGSDDYVLVKGLGRTNFISSLILTLSLLSLAGIPPLSGFAGKIFILKSVMDGQFVWLAVIAIINMTIGLYYYISIIAKMYMQEPAISNKLVSGLGLKTVFVFCLVGNLIFGILPSLGLEITNLIQNIAK